MYAAIGMASRVSMRAACPLATVRHLLAAVALLLPLLRPVHAQSDVCLHPRRPDSSFAHALLHIDGFDGLRERATSECARYGVAPYKCNHVLRTLQDAARGIARVGAREAVVNVTMDRTLAYEIYAVDKVTLASVQIDELFVVLPEDDLATSLSSFCKRHGVDDEPCASTQSRIRDLTGRDWGCDDERLAEVEAMSVTEVELSVTVDGQATNLVCDSTQDVMLEGARFCRQNQLYTTGCATVLRLLEEQAAKLPAFRLSPPTAPLVVQSPLRTRNYPVSERVYIIIALSDVASLLQGSDNGQSQKNDRVCIYLDYMTTALLCTAVPQPEPLFFERHTLPLGYHMLYFAKEEGAAVDELTNTPASPAFIAAQQFLVVSPTITIMEVFGRTTSDDKGVFFTAEIQTTAFDLIDSGYRVCILHNNDDLECFLPDRVLLEGDSVSYGDESDPYNRVTTFRAPMFRAANGSHVMTAMLIDNESSKCFARSNAYNFELNVAPPLVPADREASFLMDPSTFATQRPVRCPQEWEIGTFAGNTDDRNLAWLCEIWRHEWGFYSQNGEDGVLAFIFHNIGAVFRTYVEFGTQHARECNTRLLREAHGWSGLLMDGSNENASINLHQEWVTAENIMSLLSKYAVGHEVDLLSVDVDFNDYWILSALDLSQFSPRVVVVEVNSHIPPSEARSVEHQPGSAESWDGLTDYFGASVRAFYLWGVRNSYSLVYCESHGVNCFLVRNDVLGTNASALLQPEDLFAPPNFFGRGFSYPNTSQPHHRWTWVK